MNGINGVERNYCPASYESIAGFLVLNYLWKNHVVPKFEILLRWLQSISEYVITLVFIVLILILYALF